LWHFEKDLFDGWLNKGNTFRGTSLPQKYPFGGANKVMEVEAPGIERTKREREEFEEISERPSKQDTVQKRCPFSKNRTLIR
jgi:hypothetical protein